jgi:hypothetical protein
MHIDVNGLNRPTEWKTVFRNKILKLHQTENRRLRLNLKWLLTFWSRRSKEKRDTLFLRGGGRASYSKKVPRQCPLVLLIRIE